MEEWSTLGADTFHKLRSNSPAGGWFPALQELSWIITESNLPYADLFILPHLKKVSIYMSWLWRGPNIPHDILPTITSTISSLPTSALKSLLVCVDHRRNSWSCFKDSFSSVVLRCGSSLTELNSSIPLSDAAIDHLIRLPHLRSWSTKGPPPNFPPSSSTLIFPPLTELTLWDNAACRWLPLFERLEHSVPTAQPLTPLSRMKESLKLLSAEYNTGSIIDIPFISALQIFRNLVTLYIEANCHEKGEEGECTFRLNNDDVAEFAMALPRMESLLLGYPCARNTCNTTIACLLQISAYCAKLQELEIHFNTTTIVDDLKDVSEDPRFQVLRSLPRCTLSCLDVYHMPLILNEPGLETLAHGMIDIFPSLERCEGLNHVWNDVSRRITKLQRIRMPPACC